MRVERLKLSRFLVFFGFVVISFIVLFGRFFQIQVLQGKEYSRQFKNQCWQTLPIKAHRGTVYDRKGAPLAYSIESENFYVRSDSLGPLWEISRKTAPILGLSAHRLYEKFKGNLGRRTSLAKKVDPITSSKLRALNLPGLISEVEYDRIYPYGASVAGLLGYLDFEFLPQAGVELYCDKYLAGVDGARSYIKDGRGQLYPILNLPDIPPADGNDVYLTIDIEYQQILAEEVKAATQKWHALSGMGVLMESASGKILAVSHYDPALGDSLRRIPRERAITDLFEPGSTFKAIVYSALLEEGRLNLNDTIYAGQGCFKFNGIDLHDDKKLGVITQAEAFVLSSNIATGRLAARGLGSRQLYRYAREFGFGLSTGLDFPGEANGTLRKPEVWSEYYCALLSIGHGLSTSALQMARIFGCIANRGHLMKPLLVEKVVSTTGGTIEKYHPEIERTILSESTAEIMQRLMALVVDTGTAHYARIDGITFSGKTGTAEKPAHGSYDKSKYMASFGGFFPREKPEICGIVILDEPQPVHYGGITAAPAFAMAAKRIIELQSNHDLAPADSLYALAGIFKSADSQSISEQANDTLKISSIQMEADPFQTQSDTMADSVFMLLPDLTGKSVRSAISILSELGLLCSLEGSGNVIGSVPAAASLVKTGEEIRLICSRQEKEADY